ncbi:MAG: adenine deaminase [candidate division WOR-3 bacterium]
MKSNKSNLVNYLKTNIEIATRKTTGGLLLKNGNLVNVYSGEVYQTNVLINNDIIVAIGEDYQSAKKVIDLNGLYLLPGLIDGHIHIESSLLNLTEFARLLLLSGTTTIVADPHEITNVLGTKGIDYILNASKDLPLDVFIMIPSCVPATNFETAGGKITTKEIKKYLNHPRVLGLAEMMNFPGVFSAVPEVLEKIALVRQANKLIDGHCPRLYGKLLQAYIGAGIFSDHECTDAKEAMEKLRSGMWIMVREGTAARNLADLFAMLNIRNARRSLLVSDDKHPDDLLHNGHLNATLRKAVALGLDPVTAIQLATLNPAEYFRLADRGAIAPGKKADITIVDNLTDFNVKTVIKNGKIIVENKKLKVTLPYYQDKSVLQSIKVKPFSINKLKVLVKGDKVNVIRLIPNQIITEKWQTTIFDQPTKEIKKRNQYFESDLERDILKLVVVERHKRTGNIGIGFVSGFGLKKGAIASSVAHDSHNLVATGTNDKDIYVAIKELIKMGGGYVAVDKGKVKASLPLPIAGLMSDRPAEEVSQKLKNLLTVVKAWGSKIDNPFITLSFLALPVIPELKLTDKGLFDVTKFRIINLFE